MTNSYSLNELKDFEGNSYTICNKSGDRFVSYASGNKINSIPQMWNIWLRGIINFIPNNSEISINASQQIRENNPHNHLKNCKQKENSNYQSWRV